MSRKTLNINYTKKKEVVKDAVKKIEEVKDAVKKELNGPGERLGYRAINQKLQMEHDIKVPRDLLYTVMQ